MKLIIAGSRTVHPTVDQIDSSLDDLLFVFGDIREVVSGAASGADTAGEQWAKHYGIPVHRDPVTDTDYKTHGRYLAPKMRNRRMAEYGDAALIFWDGTSGGSSDMCCRMVARNKPVRVVPLKAAKP